MTETKTCKMGWKMATTKATTASRTLDALPPGPSAKDPPAISANLDAGRFSLQSLAPLLPFCRCANVWPFTPAFDALDCLTVTLYSTLQKQQPQAQRLSLRTSSSETVTNDSNNQRRKRFSPLYGSNKQLTGPRRNARLGVSCTLSK